MYGPQTIYAQCIKRVRAEDSAKVLPEQDYAQGEAVVGCTNILQIRLPEQNMVKRIQKEVADNLRKAGHEKVFACPARGNCLKKHACSWDRLKV